MTTTAPYDPALASTANDILNFWFVDEKTQSRETPQSALWFGGGEADELIREKFTEPLQLAATGEFDHWREQPLGTLALIVLLDQFPRNIYRGDAKAFAFGEQATEVCEHGLAANQDQQLNILERSFFYLPLEHSENRAHADRSVALYTQLAANADESMKKFADITLDYAYQHQEIIKEFDRYPYRNEVLGRETTDAEATWMTATNKRFGQ